MWPVSAIDLEFTPRRPRSQVQPQFTWLCSITTDCILALTSCLPGCLANAWLNHQALLSYHPGGGLGEFAPIEDIVCEDGSWEYREYWRRPGSLSWAGLGESWATSLVELLWKRSWFWGKQQQWQENAGPFCSAPSPSLVALWISAGPDDPFLHRLRHTELTSSTWRVKSKMSCVSCRHWYLPLLELATSVFCLKGEWVVLSESLYLGPSLL